jgi:hypothetical protein
MDATRIIDELIEAGFQVLDSGDPLAFMEWRRRVAVALGPDHVYTQLFQGSGNNDNKDSALTNKGILTVERRPVSGNKRVA